MSVSVSGPVLSALLHEHTNASSDQEGFLLGQVVSHVTDTISDSQLNNRKEEVVVYVYNYIACSRPFLWYDHAGRVNVEKLKTVLRGHKQQEVIGWYKWRRESTLMPSMREKAMHRSLLDVLAGVDRRHFVFSLFSLNHSHRQAKHTFEHMFQVLEGRSFHGLPLTVVNLKDTSQADYKRQASRTIHPREGYYAQTLHAYRSEFVDVSSDKLHQVQSVHSLNSQLHQQLMELYASVSTSEETVSRLSCEVEALRARWKRKRYPHKSTNIDTGRLHITTRQTSQSPPRPTRTSPLPTSAPPPHKAPSPTPQRAPGPPKAPSPTPQRTPGPPKAPSPLQHQRSSQEQISEELKELFLVPPAIQPCNQSGLVGAGLVGGGASKPANDRRRREELDEEEEEEEEEPSSAKLNNATPPAEPAPAKKKDAFSFVDNILQEGIKSLPSKKLPNKPQSRTRTTAAPSPSKKVNNLDTTSSDETCDMDDDCPSSPVF